VNGLPRADNENDNRVIGENIRRYRMAKGLKQEELCAGLFSVSQLSKIENGKAQLKSSQLKVIAERLGLTVDQLRAMDAFEDELRDRLQLAVHAYTAHLFEKSESMVTEVMEHCRRHGYDRLYVEALLLMCRLYNRFMHRFERVIEQVQEALASEVPMSGRNKITLLIEQGRAYEALGNMQLAFACFQQADEEFDELEGEEEDEKYLRMVYGLGTCQMRMRGARVGLRYSEIALRVANQLQKHHWRMLSMTMKATFHSLLGQHERAYDICVKALKEAMDNGMLDHIAVLSNNLGCYYRDSGRPSEALACLQRSAEVFELLGDDLAACEPLVNIAELHRREGRLQESLAFAGRVLESTSRLEGKAYLYEAQAKRVIAKLRAEQGRMQESIRLYEEILLLYEERTVLLEAYDVAAELADLLYERSDPRAIEYYRQALRINNYCRELGFKK